jgi:hypothetical protein
MFFYIVVLLVIITIFLLLKIKEPMNNENNIYVFWTGDNEMSENRSNALKNLKISECNIILINDNNLKDYILKSHPLHDAYQYLSFTHRADYLRTYFMHFYGGGYSDIKSTTGSWKKAFDALNKTNNYINGYTEIENGVATGAQLPELYDYTKLIGNCAYICKPRTAFTYDWYTSMIKLLDSKLDEIRKFPATFPQDCKEVSNGKYPIKWTEMLGDIFHTICYKYKDKILHTVPLPNFTMYR